MPTLPPDPPPRSRGSLHEARGIAESFGVDPDRYDRARPAYPGALVGRILASSPGREVLDVGCGTGIAARQFQAAGCTVLGIEPDTRMAGFARSRGLPVDVATFEAWDPDGRAFDAVIAAQSWHWVDPQVSAVKAAGVLRPLGCLAIFGHIFEPPAEIAERLAAAVRRVAPDAPFANQPARRPVAAYQALYAKVADSIRDTGLFHEPDQWRYDWEEPYTRDQWLELLPTTGGLTKLSPEKTAQILRAVGAAIDALGGRFTMSYTTLATIAVRAGAEPAVEPRWTACCRCQQ